MLNPTKSELLEILSQLGVPESHAPEVASKMGGDVAETDVDALYQSLIALGVPAEVIEDEVLEQRGR